MSSILEKKSFVSAINVNDNAYQKFNENHIPVYKEFYVESSDDVDFYGYYLAKMYHVPRLTKFHGCNGKKEVLAEYSKYKGKKAGFIVDLDYLPIDNKKYDKVIITTGYSMENFYFYKDNNQYNFEIIFKKYYPNNYQRKIKEYLLSINSFKNKYLLYYAFFKTNMEFFPNNRILLKNRIIKDLIDDDYNVEEVINLEIESLNDVLKAKFNKRYIENIKLISENEFMLLRGHDIFEHLFSFLKKDNSNVKYTDIKKMAYEMNLPDEFSLQIKFN